MPFQVSLAKERFKFSSTHFTIFNRHEAEALHGHNYSVSVDLDFRTLAEQTGLSTEFGHLKTKIDDLCQELDERVLIPTQSPFLEIKEVDTNYQVHFSKKHYSFPKEDCVLLDIVNISSECLAKWLHQKLKASFHAIGLEGLSVTVEETSGQSVTYYEED